MNILNSKVGNGKAMPGNQLEENFFNQCFVTPSPIDPRQVMIHPLPGSGIPMRDYFAAQALTLFALLDGSGDEKRVARMAYKIADAMMEVRKEKPENLGFPYDETKL
jgi:hypothetical protein